jgi:hypothetical protein
MIWIALIIGVLRAAYVVACFTALAAAAFGIIRLRAGRRRDGATLLVAVVLLIASLYCIPHLSYYVEYGIRSKVIAPNRLGNEAAAASLVVALFTCGKEKWLVATGCLLCLMLLAIKGC